MKLKTQIVSVVMLLAPLSKLIAQASPIEWLTNSYTINIDTLSNNKIDYLYDVVNSSSKAMMLNYVFRNAGEHVAFIDSAYGGRNQVISKPHETSTVSLHLSCFPFDFYHAFKVRRDTTAVLLLPFYYEGEIYRARVTCVLSFGKSKLIQYDDFQIDATKRVAQIVDEDPNRNPSLRFTQYFTIKNISDKPIFCTKALVAWNDATALRNRDSYQEILPGKTYTIPAELNMDRKYRFTCHGEVEVFGEGISEIYKCEIISKFEQVRK